MDHQQGFVVGVGSRGAPIEAPCDHRFVVDHGELVMKLIATPVPDWVLRDAPPSKARVQAVLTHWTV